MTVDKLRGALGWQACRPERSGAYVVSLFAGDAWVRPARTQPSRQVPAS